MTKKSVTQILLLTTIILLGIWQILMVAIGYGTPTMRDRGHEIWEIITHSEMIKDELNQNGINKYKIYIRSTWFTHYVTIDIDQSLAKNDKTRLCGKLSIALQSILEKDDKVKLNIEP